MNNNQSLRALTRAQDTPLPASVVGRHGCNPVLESLFVLSTVGQKELRRGINLNGAFANNKDTESWWCTQPLLSRGHDYVNTPFIHLDQLARYGTNTVQDYLVLRISH